jgi:hypothetical protein
VTEADVWRVIINTLRVGLDANGFNAVQILQSFQPRKTGASTQDTVYLYKVTTTRLGWQGRRQVYNDINVNFDVTDNYYIQATYQLTALIERDINDSISLTSYDIADTCAAVFSNKTYVNLLNDSDVRILRVGDIRSPHSIDDRDQFSQDANFDFTLIYNQTLASTESAATSVDPMVEVV